MNVEGRALAAPGPSDDHAGSDGRPEVYAAAGPHIRPARAVRSFDDPTRPAPVVVRTWCAGWHDLERALAHLVVAARSTCGEAAAAAYVRTRVVEHVAELTDAELDGFAEVLEGEAAAVAERVRRAGLRVVAGGRR